MECKSEAKFTITLSEKEARWLKDLVQNPILPQDVEEPKEHAEIRKAIWDGLSAALGPKAVNLARRSDGECDIW